MLVKKKYISGTSHYFKTSFKNAFMRGEAGMQLNQSTIVQAGSAWFSVEAYETTEVTGKPVGYRWGYLHYIYVLFL